MARWKPKFKVGDYIDDSDGDRGVIVEVVNIPPMGGYRIQMEGEEWEGADPYFHYARDEEAFTLLVRPQATDAGAEEYEMTIAAQALMEK